MPAPSFKPDLRGFRDLDEVLGNLPKAVAKRTLRDGGIKWMQPLAADMKARAPVLSGDTRDSITVGTALSRSQRKFAGIMGGRRDPNMVVIHAGPGPHPQAIIQEIGSYKEPPQPYVTPAWEAGKDALLERVAAGMWEPIEAAAARAKKKGKYGRA